MTIAGRRNPVRIRARTRRLGNQLDEATANSLVHFSLTQISMKAGIKKHGERAKESIKTKLTQLHDMHTYKTLKSHSLTRQQKRKALRMLMFLKEKRDVKVKGRGCAYGIKKIINTLQKEKASPTVTLESVIITATIDASEVREVAVTDIPGVYLHKEIEEEVWVMFEGILA